LIGKVQCVYDCKFTAMKRIQSNQMENLTKIMKSDKGIQCVRPQIRDHSNKVLVPTMKPISQSSFVGEMVVEIWKRDNPSLEAGY